MFRRRCIILSKTLSTMLNSSVILNRLYAVVFQLIQFHDILCEGRLGNIQTNDRQIPPYYRLKTKFGVRLYFHRCLSVHGGGGWVCFLVCITDDMTEEGVCIGGGWVWRRPLVTICGGSRIFPRGVHHHPKWAC